MVGRAGGGGQEGRERVIETVPRTPHINCATSRPLFWVSEWIWVWEYNIICIYITVYIWEDIIWIEAKATSRAKESRVNSKVDKLILSGWRSGQIQPAPVKWRRMHKIQSGAKMLRKFPYLEILWVNGATNVIYSLKMQCYGRKSRNLWKGEIKREISTKQTANSISRTNFVKIHNLL
jgi:hypothetical protein